MALDLHLTFLSLTFWFLSWGPSEGQQTIGCLRFCLTKHLNLACPSLQATDTQHLPYVSKATLACRETVCAGHKQAEATSRGFSQASCPFRSCQTPLCTQHASHCSWPSAWCSPAGLLTSAGQGCLESPLAGASPSSLFMKAVTRHSADRPKSVPAAT